MASSTVRTMSFAPSCFARRSRNSINSGNSWPVSTLRNGIGMSDGRNAFSASRSRQMESLPPENKQRRALKFSGDFTHDVNGFGFEVLQVIEVI